jgi:hypothetical protein
MHTELQQAGRRSRAGSNPLPLLQKNDIPGIFFFKV